MTLIADHVFLIDTKKKFQGKKYILIIAPDKNQEQEDDKIDNL